MSLRLHMQNHKEPLENEKFKWCLRRMQMPSNRQFFSDAHYLTPSWLGIVQRYWRMLIPHELDWKRDCFYSGNGRRLVFTFIFVDTKTESFFLLAFLLNIYLTRDVFHPLLYFLLKHKGYISIHCDFTTHNNVFVSSKSLYLFI